MPRTIWSGAISFGLVTVPIQVQSATENHSISFHMYHEADGGRVRIRKYCDLEDREVRADEIGKGYEWSKDRVIPITDQELRELPLPTAKAVEIHAFVPLASIDPLQIAEGYYLSPDGQVAAKPYKLLLQALSRSSRVAIAKWAVRGRERLGLLRVRDGVICLHVLRWPDEIRSPEELFPPPADVSDDEIDEAVQLIDSMTTDTLEGPEFRDHYTEALEQVIEAKREGQALPEAPEPEVKSGQVLDLMATLRESVEKAQASRGETGKAAVHEPPPKKTTKKAATKKASAQKAASKGATAKKTGGRRPHSA
ncbi:non-homologous end joining protein Ku [Streptomyces viridochromogenes]|uniref:non-homologous end joining protein Ku n=1 Tax=Streptomyces viridochromogenes TaxID=1938 RepID=UPI0002D6213E|nr:Ku protein [Streptomyces viridochromogenes]